MSLFGHCSIKFKPYVVWFLCDNKDFFNRKLKIGLCPKCLTLHIELEECRKADNKTFYDVARGSKAQVIKARLKADRIYSSLDLQMGNSVLYGFRYGVNKEKFNQEKGKTEIEQYSCDFYGNKELIKKV